MSSYFDVDRVGVNDTKRDLFSWYPAYSEKYAVEFLKEWSLPGHGEAYSDCGSLRFKGCLDQERHVQEGQKGVYVKAYKRTCLRAECPICYESWAGKEAEKLEYRLKKWSPNYRYLWERSLKKKDSRHEPIHVVASPSMKDLSLSYEELRRKCYRVLKKTGVLGGAVVFHPFRINKKTKEVKFSPHFHSLVYGWVTRIKENYEESGWVVKNTGVRKSVKQTVLYLLSHCGINPKHHSVTWFGKLSYNKLRVKPKLEEPELCPICKTKIKELLFLGDSSELVLDEEWFGDVEKWVYKPKRFDYG